MQIRFQVKTLKIGKGGFLQENSWLELSGHCPISELLTLAQGTPPLHGLFPASHQGHVAVAGYHLKFSACPLGQNFLGPYCPAPSFPPCRPLMLAPSCVSFCVKFKYIFSHPVHTAFVLFLPFNIVADHFLSVHTGWPHSLFLFHDFTWRQRLAGIQAVLPHTIELFAHTLFMYKGVNSRLNQVTKAN